VLSRFATIPEREGQTDRRTDRQTDRQNSYKYRTSAQKYRMNVLSLLRPETYRTTLYNAIVTVTSRWLEWRKSISTSHPRRWPQPGKSNSLESWKQQRVSGTWNSCMTHAIAVDERATGGRSRVMDERAWMTRHDMAWVAAAAAATRWLLYWLEQRQTSVLVDVMQNEFYREYDSCTLSPIKPYLSV